MITDNELIQRIISRLNERDEAKNLDSGFSYFTSTKGDFTGTDSNPCIVLNGMLISVCENEDDAITQLIVIEKTLNAIKKEIGL